MSCKDLIVLYFQKSWSLEEEGGMEPGDDIIGKTTWNFFSFFKIYIGHQSCNE